MSILFADSFNESLARLTADEQKLPKTTAFDLQMNRASPGMLFRKLDRAKDKNFWSARVGSDLRLIVHKAGPADRVRRYDSTCFPASEDELLAERCCVR